MTNEDIIYLATKGKAPKEIAAITGFSTTKVRNVLYKAKIRTKRTANDVLPELITMRENGRSLEYMSKKTGLSQTTISNALSRAGYRKNAGRVSNHYVNGLRIDESKLTYADHTVKIKKVICQGKKYADITPIIAGW